jgi:hypothetical protein
MADDPIQRSYRSSEPPARTAPGATPASSNDPLAELARLIGQSDPFAEFGRGSEHRAAAAPAAPVAPPAAPTYGSNDYYASAPVTPPQEPEAAPYGAPIARQAYSSPSYAAGADPYHPDNQASGFPGALAGGYQSNPYQPNPMHQADEEDDIYDDIPPPRRRVGVLAIAALFALAVIGTAGAFGYRALFGSSGSNLPPPVIKADTQPIKVVPANANKTPNKLITDRVSDHAQDEKLVSREEKPVEMGVATPAGPQPSPPQDNAQQVPQGSGQGSGAIAGEPRKIHTITIRPDQLGSGGSQPGDAMATAPAPAAPPPRIAGPSPIKPVAPRSAASAPVANAAEPPARPAEPRAAPIERRAAAPARNANAPLSLNPDAADAAPAPRAPMRTAAAAAPLPVAQASNASAKPAAGGSGAYVQVSSQRSEADAQAAFHSLQAKYPSQLGSRQPVIRKVELGDKGTYYRAMVGPLAGNEASELCGGIKSAGGSCIIQRN